MLEDLKFHVCRANRQLIDSYLAMFGYGCVSAINREAGVIAVRPDGVPLEELRPDQIVICDLNGNLIEGEYAPAREIKAHVELYKTFPGCMSIANTRSKNTAAFAQSCKSIPPMGTLHADYFHGTIPVTRLLTKEELGEDFYKNVGITITEAFKDLSSYDVPAVLAAQHGAFVWGRNPEAAVKLAEILETVAELAITSLNLTPGIAPISNALLDRRYTDMASVAPKKPQPAPEAPAKDSENKAEQETAPEEEETVVPEEESREETVTETTTEASAEETEAVNDEPEHEPAD